MLLGQARGAAISVSVLNDLDVYEYTALQIKKSVVGNGHAAKEQVQMMVKKLLDLPALTSKDSADALACAHLSCKHKSEPCKILMLVQE